MMKDLTWLKKEYIAHRGLHTRDQTIPENSKKAFQNALKHGYAIECDLNILKDGTVVVFHDKDLNRLCGLDQKLSELTFEDIKDKKILKSDETIMRFDELLSLVGGKVPLLIELKPFGDTQKLCEEVAKHLDAYPHAYAIFSFHPNIVYWFKKHRPNVIRGQISEYFRLDKHMNPLMKYGMKSLFFNRFTKPDFISYGIHDLPNKYCDRAFKKGMTVISYAAKNQDELDFVRSTYHNVVFEHFIPKKERDCNEMKI